MKNKNSTVQPSIFRRSILRTAILSALFSTLWVGHAYAENEENTDDKPSENKIIVTAQHREESPQEVPIAISLFQADELEKMAAQNINDLGSMTPGIETNNVSVTQPSYNIRGITTNDFGVGSDPAVAVYVDGVYIGRGGASQANFNDIQRVEILKGPQGTLFGRNAAAGAIHIVTNRAESETSGRIGMSFGSFGKTKVSGVFNTGLSENVFFRGSFVDNRRNGYIESASGGKKLGTEDSQSVKGSLLWEFDENTDVIFRFDRDEVSQDGPISASQNQSIAPALPFGPVDLDVRPLEQRNLWGTSLEVVREYEDFAMTYIAAYREFESGNLQDDDGSANSRFFFSTHNKEDQDQLSHELRFSSTSDSDLKWTVGANYSVENIQQKHSVFANTNTLDTFFLVDSGVPSEVINSLPLGMGLNGFFSSAFANELGQLSGLSGIPVDFLTNMIVTANLNRDWLETTQDTGEFTSVAFYTDFTYALTDKLDLTFGLRYTSDEKDFEVASQWSNEFIIPLPGAPSVPFGLVFFDQFDPPVKQNDSWDAWTPRFVLDYKWTDDIMTYVSSAKGYKSGGFNSLGVDPAFDEENVLNNEIGIKSIWNDGKVLLNIALYDYDYDDLQILKLSGPSGAIPTYNVGNADAKGNGIDVDFDWQISDNFHLAANYSHVETEYTSYTLFPGETAADDLTGKPLSSIPENKWNLVADYNLNLNNYGDVEFRLHYNFTDDRVNQTESVSNNVIKDYSLVNARVSFYPADANWELALWANNLTDEEYLYGIGGQGSAVGSPTTTRALPRMVGLDFTLHL